MRFYLLFFLFAALRAFSNELVLTIPKCGTNLVLKCVKLITCKQEHRSIRKIGMARECFDDVVFWTHYWRKERHVEAFLGPSDEKIAICNRYGIKVILVLRDPRDLVCALARAHFNKTDPETLLKIIESPGKVINAFLGCKQKRVEYPSLSSCFSDYLRWMQYQNIYLTSYEKLVGPQGGGDRELQIQEIVNIAAFIGKKIDYERACVIADSLFGNTSTFRQGQINGWKKAFTPEVLQAFIQKEGNLANLLGY